MGEAQGAGISRAAVIVLTVIFAAVLIVALIGYNNQQHANQVNESVCQFQTGQSC